MKRQVWLSNKLQPYPKKMKHILQFKKKKKGKKKKTTTTRDRSEEWKQKRVKRKENEIKGSIEKREEDRSVERKARAN